MEQSSTFSIAGEFPPVSYEQWRGVAEKDLGGAPFDKKLVTRTYEGIAIQPVYTRENWSAEGDPSGFPGQNPMTRGARPLAGVLGGVDIRQEHLHPDLETTRQAILTDLERGVTSILLRLDAAGRIGVDPDDAEAAELAGRDGVTIYSLADLEAILDGVHLHMINVALEAGAAFAPASALLVAAWKKRGIDLGEARGAFNADPLAVLARHGMLPMPVDASIEQMTELAKWTAANLPHVTAVRVGTGPYHHAGADAAQDLGIAMATGVAYLRAMTEAGLDVNRAARQIVFNFQLGTNFFLAIAKLRAARKLWAKVIEVAGGDPEAARMLIHARTSKRVMTTRDPWVNLLRNTVTCFAGAVGGAQVISSSPFDAAIGLPDDFSRRIARNTPIILQEEARLSEVADPAGGSWFIESLTDELAEKGWAQLQRIEGHGGMAEALRSGWIAEQIESAFEPRAKNLSRRRDPVTGVSEFPNLREKPVDRPAPDYAAVRQAAIERLKRTRKADPRDALVQQLTAAAAHREGAGDLFDRMVEAYEAGLSLGQVAQRIWTGKDQQTIAPLAPHPYAEAFEALRDAADHYESLTGQRPRVFLANMGPASHYSARTGYARNFFEAGGFEIIGDEGFKEAEQAAKAFADSGAHIAVICSSDKLYDELVPAVAPALRQAGARTIILAGHPGEKEQTYRDAGVDRFIFVKCDVLQVLRELLQEEGVLR